MRLNNVLVRAAFVASLLMLSVVGCGESPGKTWERFQAEFWAAQPQFNVSGAGVPLTVDQWAQAVREVQDPGGYAARAMAIAKANPGSPTAAQAVGWIISFCPETPACKEAVEILSADFSEHFARQARAVVSSNTPYADRYLRAIVEFSPRREMQGQALFGRALFREGVMRDRAMAVELLERVVAEFGAVRVGPESAATLGELAEMELARLRNGGGAAGLVRPGAKAPGFSAVTTTGGAVDFPAGFRARLVLLDFWATWCGPCVREVPVVVAAYEKYRGKGLEVLGVSLDREGTGAAVGAFVAKHRMTWPQIHDGKLFDSPIVRAYGVDAIPCAVLVDLKTGEVVSVGDALRGHGLELAIERALARP